jgi:glutamyl-tRNA reductase
LRRAYSLAQSHHSTGKILNQLAQRAFKIGKKTYTETSIHKGAISISLAAVELAVETFSTLKNKTVLIIGAGDTARLAAESLLKKNVGKILITNRTKSRAEELLLDLRKSHNFESETIEFGDFKDVLNRTDIVISSTGSPVRILTLEDFKDQTNKILLIDIAVPRDIDASVSRNENILLKNIDDLHSIVDKNFERRMKDLPRVKKIIMHEMSDFLMWYYSIPLLPDFRRRAGKPADAAISEIKEIKKFLLQNVSEIHKSTRQTNGDSNLDLKNHLDLVKKLYAAKNGFSEVSER